jgi:hypothetical protein
LKKIIRRLKPAATKTQYIDNGGLEALLNDSHVVCHSFVIGELACGNLKNRSTILSLLATLPLALHAEHDEVLRLTRSAA